MRAYLSGSRVLLKFIVHIQKSATGLDLFQEVCQHLSLRQREFFGLYYFKHPSELIASTGNSAFKRRTWHTQTTEECAIYHRGIPV